MKKEQGIPMFDIPTIEPTMVLEHYKETGVLLINGIDNNSISLVILGEPKAQKRHRHVNMGKFTRQYDPSAADKGDFLSMVQSKAPGKPFDVPVALTIGFYFSRPKNHYKTGKNSHLLKDTVPLWHISKPDVDNCFKFCTDALNKVFWRDDSLICNVSVIKQYSNQPRIEITITPIKNLQHDKNKG